LTRNLLLWLTLLFITLTTPMASRAAAIEANGTNFTPPGHKVTITYRTKPGDTLWGISKRLGISVSTLMSENHISNARFLQVGQILQHTQWDLPQVLQTLSKPSRPPSPTSRGADLSSLTSMPYTEVLYCTLTAYTAGPESTGKTPGDPAYDITSTGTHAQEGVTVAVDPSVIPYGTKLYIPGIGYRVAEDTGGAIRGDHIDIFYNQRSTAVRFGVKYRQKVYLLPDWYHIPI